MADVQTWLIEHDPIPLMILRDPAVDETGFPVTDLYVERFWLPVLGPSATWALRRLAAWLEAEPHGFPLPQVPLARELAWAATSVGTAPPRVPWAGWCCSRWRGSPTTTISLCGWSYRHFRPASSPSSPNTWRCSTRPTRAGLRLAPADRPAGGADWPAGQLWRRGGGRGSPAALHRS